jgi:hypothetical protein
MFGGQQDTTASANDAMNGTLPPPDSATDPASDPMPSDVTTGFSAAGSSPAPTPSTAPDDPGPTGSPASSSEPEASAASLPTPAGPADADALLDIKQRALQMLSPLVGHLDQPPEDKFRTTMMMIQASDDSSLIPEAYDAAQQISDDKVKAQALLDIVNEINYFTQHQGNK